VVAPHEPLDHDPPAGLGGVEAANRSALAPSRLATALNRVTSEPRFAWITWRAMLAVDSTPQRIGCMVALVISRGNELPALTA
jgi:hypothetical protein